MNRYTVIAVVLLLALIAGLWIRGLFPTGSDHPGGNETRSPTAFVPWETSPRPIRNRRDRHQRNPGEFSDGVTAAVNRPARAGFRGALPGERTLMFASAEAYRAFLDAAGDLRSVKLLGSLEKFHAVRLGGVESDEVLARLFDELGMERPQVAANYAVFTPRIPTREERGPLNAEPFQNGAIEWLGLSGVDLSEWGSGVRVAVLDGGVAPIFGANEVSNTIVHDSAPAPEGVAAMHGTAVSSIIISEDARIPGIAPAAELLGFSVLGEDGFSDSFTLASGIVAAVDAGVDLINASLGSAGDSPVVHEAVRYAAENGVLIVASAGNEQSSEVAFPARYPETIAVGAVDALGRQLNFSNSGEALGLGAPGQEIYAFGSTGSPVSFSGTSASAPFVTGAIAAVMSSEPNLSARQAVDLLFEFADEAGVPGPDRHYGFGNLNINRVLKRNQPGIRDIAVASQYLTQNAVGQPVVRVVVENRGTSVAQGPRLNVQLDGSSRELVLSPIQPNAVTSRDFPLLTGGGTEGEAVRVSSRVTWNGDINQRNDLRATEIRGGPTD